MGLRDIARWIEDGINRRGIVRKRKKGWYPRVVPFIGYGSTRTLHVLARVIMADPQDGLDDLPDLPDNLPFTLDPRVAALEAQRGWRQFFTTQVGFIELTITAGSKQVVTRTNRGGYIDVLIEDHQFEPGWHKVKIEPSLGMGAEAEVLILGEDVTTGIISDVDDTIMVTWLPRLLLAGWNSWVCHSSNRTAVEGMAELYQNIIKEHPGTAMFYLSTGAWNTFPTLQIFMRKHGFPRGPVLITDWGPTPTGIFRSGPDHKRVQLRNIFLTFPNIKWLLVGDNGQHDTVIYNETSIEHPRHVEAIAIRELTPTEQVLSHGSFESLDSASERQLPLAHWVQCYHGSNGYTLAQKLKSKLWTHNETN